MSSLRQAKWRAVAAAIAAALLVASPTYASRLDDDLEDIQPQQQQPPQAHVVPGTEFHSSEADASTKVEFPRGIGHPDEPTVPAASHTQEDASLSAQKGASTTTGDPSSLKSVSDHPGPTANAEVHRGEVINGIHTVRKLVDETEALASSMTGALQQEVFALKAENRALRTKLQESETGQHAEKNLKKVAESEKAYAQEERAAADLQSERATKIERAAVAMEAAAAKQAAEENQRKERELPKEPASASRPVDQTAGKEASKEAAKEAYLADGEEQEAKGEAKSADDAEEEAAEQIQLVKLNAHDDE